MGLRPPFQKGKSGNPGGRPKGYAEFAARAREMSGEGLEALYRIAKDGRQHVTVRIMAWKTIIERGYGKSVQPVAPGLDTIGGERFVMRMPAVALTAQDWETQAGAERAVYNANVEQVVSNIVDEPELPPIVTGNVHGQHVMEGAPNPTRKQGHTMSPSVVYPPLELDLNPMMLVPGEPRGAKIYFHLRHEMVCRDLPARFRCARLMFSPRLDYIALVGPRMIQGQLGEPKIIRLTGYLFTILTVWNVADHNWIAAVACGIAATVDRRVHGHHHYPANLNHRPDRSGSNREYPP